jgi:chromosome segregation ATPase
MPKRVLPATGEAVSTADAKLLRLEAEFNANSDREERAADKLDEIDAEIDRLRKRMRRVDRKLDRRTQEGSRLFDKIMATRAKSLDGMLAKVRVRKRWNTDDETSEIAILKSLVKDLQRMARAT